MGSKGGPLEPTPPSRPKLQFGLPGAIVAPVTPVAPKLETPVVIEKPKKPRVEKANVIRS